MLLLLQALLLLRRQRRAPVFPQPVAGETIELGFARPCCYDRRQIGTLTEDMNHGCDG